MLDVTHDGCAILPIITYKPFMLIVIMLNVIMLNVVAPLKHRNRLRVTNKIAVLCNDTQHSDPQHNAEHCYAECQLC